MPDAAGEAPALRGMRLTVLGTRGSMSVSGTEYREFGGATSCYLVEAGEHTVLLDAGTGILRAPVQTAEFPIVLLSHLHADHVMGLGTYPRLSCTDARTDVYVPAQSDEEAERLLACFYGPPLWPVGLDSYPGAPQVRALPAELHLGDLTIDVTEGCHPGGCKAFRLRYGGATLVYATDFEHTEDAVERLAEFAHGADLLLYDGQYDETSYEAHQGFGHSTPQMGLELLRRSGARRLLVIHHDPQSSDESLRRLERELGSEAVSFAREGQTIELVGADADGAQRGELAARGATGRAEGEEELGRIAESGARGATGRAEGEEELGRIAELEAENARLQETIRGFRVYLRSMLSPYVTPEVLDAIFKQESGSMIAGERREVTMMFCDIRHSTELAEQLRAEELIRLLNHYFAEMITIIDSWQGNILEFAGDSIVVVFGAPEPNEEAAYQAVACAVAMQRRMPAVNEWNDAAGYPHLHMGIGIHTGEAILGSVGSPTRMKYDMIGRNVNLASRIESFTRGGQILVSSQAFEAAGPSVVERPEGGRWVHPKGFKHDVWVHDVIGFGSLRIP